MGDEPDAGGAADGVGGEGFDAGADGRRKMGKTGRIFHNLTGSGEAGGVGDEGGEGGGEEGELGGGRGVVGGVEDGGCGEDFVAGGLALDETLEVGVAQGEGEAG